MTIRIPVTNPPDSHADLVVQAINVISRAAEGLARPPVAGAMFRLSPGESGEAYVHAGQSLCIFEVPSKPLPGAEAQG